MKTEDFCDKVKNSITGKINSLMKTNKNACIFFDSTNGKCGIHAVRPVDCRLFPLDIQKVDGKYYWIMYNYKHCKLDDEDQSQLLAYRSKALSLLGNEIKDYATFPIPGMAKLPREIIGEVEVSPHVEGLR